jgi:hypothetical protein
MIPTLYVPASFTGNSSAVTAYVCPWKALAVGDLRVLVTDEDGGVSSAWFHGSGITVSLVGNTVEFVTDDAIPSTSTLTAFLAMNYLQQTDLQNSGNNDVNVRERMFDRLTLYLQIALAGVSETAGIPITFPPNEIGANQVLPSAPFRENSFLYFDENGDLTVYAYATLLSNIRAFLLGDPDASAALSNNVVNQATGLTMSQAGGFKLYQMDAAAGNLTVTCPRDSAATIAIGTKWDFSLASSSNKVLFVAGSGATLRSAEGATPQIEAQWGGATVAKRAANTYQVFGRITAQ